jgi:hypothetical protein
MEAALLGFLVMAAVLLVFLSSIRYVLRSDRPYTGPQVGQGRGFELKEDEPQTDCSAGHTVDCIHRRKHDCDDAR